MDETGIVRELGDRMARRGFEKVPPHRSQPSGHHELHGRLPAMRPECRLEVTVADTGHCAQATKRDRFRKMGIDPRLDGADAPDSVHGCR